MITPPLSMSAMPRLTRAVPVCVAAASVPVGLAELDAVLRDTVDLIRIGGVVLGPW
jgi:hypothetical protein